MLEDEVSRLHGRWYFSFRGFCKRSFHLPSDQHSTWKFVVGRWISFWDGLFSEAFGVSFRECNHLVWGTTCLARPHCLTVKVITCNAVLSACDSPMLRCSGCFFIGGKSKGAFDVGTQFSGFMMGSKYKPNIGANIIEVFEFETFGWCSCT